MRFPWIIDRMISQASRSPFLQKTFAHAFSGVTPELLPLVRGLLGFGASERAASV
jgi:hypothetical protein